MKQIIPTLSLLIGLLNNLMAQPADKKSMEMGGGGFNIGYGYMDVSKLNVFIPENTSKFKNSMLLVGGSGHIIIENFVIGGSGFGIIGDEIKTDSFKVNLNGGLGTFDVGYVLINKKRLKFYPMLGIGRGGFGLQILSNKNLSIDHVVKNPGQEINISQSNFVADVSLNLDIIPFLKYNELENSYGGFMTGIKIGYIYSLPSSDWEYAGGDINGGPNFGYKMFYFKLILGGFGYQNNKNK